MKYDRTTVVLHWLTALLVVGLWTVGQTADDLPKGSVLKTFVWSSHVTFGFALAGLFVWRVLWRATRGRGLPAADTGALHIVAKGTHYALYVLLLVTLSLGIANAFIRGYGLYNLFHLPQLGDPAWKRPVTDWHGLAADGILVVAFLHASAALIHQYVWKDHLLERMSPR